MVARKIRAAMRSVNEWEWGQEELPMGEEEA
jgi:hypothetical protein